MNKNPEIQFRSPEEIKAYQESRLAEELLYLQNHSRFYQRLFQAHHIDIQQIKTIEDLQQIPVTTKTDLQLHNEDFICVSRDEIIDYVTTSGTLGDPVTFVLTSEDLDRLAYNEYLSFTTTGCSRQDVLQLMTTIDRRFMAGLAYYMGARELGMGVARVGNGIPELQWDTIRRIHPTCGMVVPSFLIKLIEFAEKNLKPEGVFVTKVFQGSGYSQFVESCKRVFKTVKQRKPEASRDTSPEMYVVGRGLKPAKKNA